MTAHRTIASLVEEYLSSRRKLGFALKIEGLQLLSFARYADQSDHQGPITTELAVRWAMLSRGADPTCPARRLDIVRQFARYRALFDPHTEIPPKGLLGPSRRGRPPPHIYTDEELKALLRAASKLGTAGGLRRHTYVTLLGLLACTGLRISEALKLTQDDIDLHSCVVTVLETKFHKSRLVPIHPSTAAALSRYSGLRDCCYPLPQSKAFFVNDNGRPLRYRSVMRTFIQLRATLGWKRTDSRSPRIHDLRHRFAVRRLIAWYEEGADIDRKIAALSTYLGHTKITDTYWYLTAVPELLAVTSSRFERFADQGIGGES